MAAVIVNVYVPVVPAAGIPESVAVPFPLLNWSPDGSGGTPGVSDKIMGRVPVVVTVKVPNWPTVNVSESALVIAGAAMMATPLVLLGAEALSVARRSPPRGRDAVLFRSEARAIRHWARCGRCPDGARRADRGHGRWRPGVCRAGHPRGQAR